MDIITEHFNQIIEYAIKYEQLLITVLVGTVTALSILVVILHHIKRNLKARVEKEKTKLKKVESKVELNVVPIPSNNQTANVTITEIKKEISIKESPDKHINTEYNLEEFLIRLFKTGIAVTRLKEGLEKQRCIGLNKNGEICMHKITHPNVKPNANAAFVRFPISKLIGCFHSTGTSKPSFIMDFKVKIWHLAVETALDANYIVKGFKTMTERASREHNFVKNLTNLLSQQSNSIQMKTIASPISSTTTITTTKGTTSTAALLLSTPSSTYTDIDCDDNNSVSTINTTLLLL